MGRPYYSRIAKQWHDITGYHGGPFKKYVLNDHLLEQISSIDNLSILELGAGNGYFMPKALTPTLPAHWVGEGIEGADSHFVDYIRKLRESVV